jgi:predicted unusual protein kinase regulating ubiquinone biosynthesis (AarF/ABC1/UbiB family)
VLDALHAAGVTHGDPSPDNLLVRPGGRVLLLDHEGLGELGAPRSERTTEGFGERGGLREVNDDHRALAAITLALAGRAGQAPSEDALEAFVRALREGRTEDARRSLGLALPAPARSPDAPRARWPRVLAAIALVALFAAAIGRALGLF